MINTNYEQAKYSKAQNSYHDFAGLTDLKQGAKQDDPEALKEAARQFEALFVQMILKSAREADELIGGEESLLRSKEMSFFQDMLDEQFSLAISQAGSGSGLGLAEVLVRQLGKTLTSPLTEETATRVKQDAQAIENELMAKLNLRRLSSSQKQLEVATAHPPLQAAANSYPAVNALAANNPVVANTAVSNPATPEKTVTTTANTQAASTSLAKKSFFASPRDFVKHIYPLAQKTAKKLGVDPKLLVAQTALETGWGKYMVAKADGSSSFNLFNIKADHRWQGAAAQVQTLEYRNGKPQQERWPFRAYSSLEESMQDYLDFLHANPRYQQALKNTSSPQAFATSLQQAGYATDPNYAKKILNIMESPRLAEAMQGLEN